MNINCFKTCCIVLLNGLLVTNVYGAAFQIQEQHAASLGTAYSGTALQWNDASSAFYNPAALRDVDEKAFSLSTVVIHTNGRVTLDEAYASIILPPLDPLSHDHLVESIPVPAFHYAARLGKDWIFGLGIAAPYGLKTHYDDVTSSLRFVATRSKMQTVNVGPSLVYAPFKHFSIAVGPDWQKGTLHLDSALYTGVQEGYARYTLSDTSWGWHTGMPKWNDGTGMTPPGLSARPWKGLPSTPEA